MQWRRQCSGGAGGQPVEIKTLKTTCRVASQTHTTAFQRSEPRRCASCGHDRSEEYRTTEQSVVNCPETGSPTDGEHDNEHNVHVRGIDGLSAWPTFARATASWYWQCPKPDTFSRSAQLEACLCGPTSASSRGDGAPTFRNLITTALAKCD